MFHFKKPKDISVKNKNCLNYSTSALTVKISVLGCRCPGWKWIASWKNEANVFQVYRFCPGKIAKTRIMVYFLFENSLDIFLFVLYKYFMYGIVYLVLIWSSLDQKKRNRKLPWHSSFIIVFHIIQLRWLEIVFLARADWVEVHLRDNCRACVIADLVVSKYYKIWNFRHPYFCFRTVFSSFFFILHVDYALSKVCFTRCWKKLYQQKKVINKYFSVFFFNFWQLLFLVGFQVEHKDERPYAKFKHNLPWKFKESWR